MTDSDLNPVDDLSFDAFEFGVEFPLVFDGEVTFLQYQGRGWAPSLNGGEHVGVFRSSRGGFLVATKPEAALMLDALDDEWRR